MRDRSPDRFDPRFERPFDPFAGRGGSGRDRPQFRGGRSRSRSWSPPPGGGRDRSRSPSRSPVMRRGGPGGQPRGGFDGPRYSGPPGGFRDRSPPPTRRRSPGPGAFVTLPNLETELTFAFEQPTANDRPLAPLLHLTVNSAVLVAHQLPSHPNSNVVAPVEVASLLLPLLVVARLLARLLLTSHQRATSHLSTRGEAREKLAVDQGRVLAPLLLRRSATVKVRPLLTFLTLLALRPQPNFRPLPRLQLAVEDRLFTLHELPMFSKSRLLRHALRLRPTRSARRER